MGEVVLIGFTDQAGRALALHTQARPVRSGYRNLIDDYIYADACLAKLSTRIAIVTDEL